MFDIGFWELATIAIIGIVVVGPKRLPEVVRTILIVIRKIRRAFNNIKDDIERELDLDNLRREMDNLDLEDHIKKLNQSVMDMDKNIRDEAGHLDGSIRDHIRHEYERDDDMHEGHDDHLEYDDMEDTGEEPVKAGNPPIELSKEPKKNEQS